MAKTKLKRPKKPDLPLPVKCDHIWLKDGRVGLVLFYRCAVCGDTDERDVS